jgi:uncharacterized membrane protein
MPIIEREYRNYEQIARGIIFLLLGLSLIYLSSTLPAISTLLISLGAIIVLIGLALIIFSKKKEKIKI